MTRETSYQQIAHTILTGLKDRDWDVLRLTLSERFLPNLSESRPGSVPLQARPA